MPRQIDFDLLAAEYTELWQGHLAVIESLIFIEDDEGPEQHTALADRLLFACSVYQKLTVALIEENSVLYREHLRNARSSYKKGGIVMTPTKRDKIKTAFLIVVFAAALPFFGCGLAKNDTTNNSQIYWVVSVGFDISQTVELKNIPGMDQLQLEELLSILSGHNAELAWVTIGEVKYPRLEYLKFIDVRDYRLSQRRTIMHDQRKRAAAFKAAVLPRIQIRKDRLTHFKNAMEKLAIYYHEPRPQPVRRLCILFSDCIEDDGERQQPPFGQLANGEPSYELYEDPVNLPNDVEVLVVSHKLGVADHLFHGPIHYFGDADRLLDYLRTRMEKGQ